MLEGIDSINGGAVAAMIDGYTRALVAVDSNHSKLHKGEAFTMSSKMDIAASKVGAIQLTAPAGTAAALTSNMTNANADPTYTATSIGVWGNATTVVYVDPGVASSPLSVSVNGQAITVSLATDSEGAITTTAKQLADAINAHFDASKIVACTAEGTGAGVVNALAVANLTGGVNAIYVHFKPTAVTTSAGPVTVSLLEDYSFVGGSALTPMNRNRTGTPPTSGITMKGLADVSAVAGSAQKTLDTMYIAGASLQGNSHLGGSVSAAEEWVLKPGVNYLLTFTNANAGTVTLGFELFWYEEAKG